MMMIYPNREGKPQQEDNWKMIYQVSRDENEATIRQLANKYPKCFFEDPHQRLPLNKSIAIDLQNDGFPAAYELIVSAIAWYMKHFAYQYALQAGAKRIDLNGKEVGTVTEQEYLAAQNKIKADQQKRNERSLGHPVKTMMPLQSSGRISDDQMRKVDAPPISPVKAASVSPAELQVSPELTPLYEALRAANNALSATPNGELRAALASAALGVVVKEAQRAIAGFSSNQ